MRWEGGYLRLDAHLARLARACRYLGIRFAPEEARDLLATLATGFTAPSRVRLLVRATGALEPAAEPLPPVLPEPVPVGLAFERVDERDPLRRHKTTSRALYDAATRRAVEAGLADVVFLSRQGRVAEGAISNVFVKRGARLVTPPVGAGALPGVLRGELLASGRCEEAEVDLAELEAGGFYLGSSLRGLRRAVLSPGLVTVYPGP